MAVYKGVLKRLSAGTQTHSTESAGSRFTLHEFIEIGDHRLKSVRVLAYHEILLGDALGQEVELSLVKVRGQHIVVSFKLPDGTVEKIDAGIILLPMLWFGAQRVLVALLFLGIAYFTLSSATPVAVVMVLLAAFLVIPFARTFQNVLSARTAL